MDADVLAERILLDLKNTFQKDPLIDEFDVLPVHESVSNKCPVIHVEHKLALEDWCVKHVYDYAYSKFFAWKRKPYKLDPECVLTWTSAILLLNPEIDTAWNARKELVCQNVILPENELKFSELVLSRKPKSSPIFSHRKWLMMQIQKSGCSSCMLQQVVEHEISVCVRAANLYPNNYYAWCHRSWVLKEVCQNCTKIILEEIYRTEQWASTHVSDYSGFHYRQFLLSNCSSTAKSCPLHLECIDNSDASTNGLNTMLLKELIFISSLQSTYLGHETLWYHRRYLLHEFNKRRSLVPIISDVQVTEDSAKCKRHKLECESIIGWDAYREELFLKDRFQLYKNKEWEETLIQKHAKWLKCVLKWSVSLASS